MSRKVMLCQERWCDLEKGGCDVKKGVCDVKKGDAMSRKMV